jgi:hypothetical protein
MPNREKKHINSEDVKRQNKDEEKYTNNIITKNYITHEHKD